MAKKTVEDRPLATSHWPPKGEEEMKGFIARIDKSAVDLSVKTVTALALSGAALGMANGCHYRDLVDPCYPQRYEYASRMEVNQALAPQVRNGHILDQTVWNYEFEQGTPKLTPGGMEHLAYLARRRPTPDTCIYLQVAEPPDIIYDPKTPEKYAESRAKLDNDRIAAIQAYLGAETAGRNLAFTIVVHDPAEVGIAAIPEGKAITASDAAFSGVLQRLTIGGGAAR
jgi:hypothetical protein